MEFKKRIVSGILVTALSLSMVFNAAAASRDPAPNQRQLENAALAETVATEGIVLLENKNNVLPIDGPSAEPIALFGVGAARTYRGGGGSGDPWNGGLSGGGDPRSNQNPRWNVNIYDAFKKAGYSVTNADYIEDLGNRFDKQFGQTMGGMDVFRYPEDELTETQVQEAANGTDTAIFVIARDCGEGSDRSQNPRTVSARLNGPSEPAVSFQVGDYNMLEKEKENLRLISENFENVIVVINTGGQIDTKFFKEIPGLDALVFMGMSGQEGGAALVKLLNGQINPSGKLINTWAENYTDYPASATFGNNDGTDNNERYVEGIYVGYRYFDTAGVTPAYPFGYGLSYTNFDINVLDVKADEKTVTLKVQVENTGDRAGKEVVQVYYSAPDGSGGDKSYQTEKAYQDLIVYGKTDLLQPGEKQVMELSYNTTDMAYYNEKDEGKALDPGNYILRVGNSSRNTHVAAVLNLDSKVITEQLKNLMHTPWDILEEKGDVWSKTEEGWIPYTYSSETQEINNAQVINLSASKIETKTHVYSNLEESVTTYTTDSSYQPQTRGYQEYSYASTGTTTGWTGAMKEYEEKVELVAKEDITLLDVYEGKKTLEQLVAQMSLYELATLNCGSGWGVWDELAPITGSEYDSIPGAAAETTRELMDKYDIPFFVVNDGPGGLRVRHEFLAKDVNTGEMVTVYNYSTAWPVSIVRAATWNLDLLYEVGRGYAKEMEEMGITQLLGTSLNIQRDPLCGRNFEYYSEDPVISGYTVSAVTSGLQATSGIGACIKHYAANQQETRRNGGNSVMSERTAREIYLKGFEIGIKSSQPMSIMTSYNLINNVPSADDYDLLNNITRDEWGYQGHIMTDWNGGRSTPAKSMHGGNDFITPGGPGQVRAIMRYFGEEGAAPVFKENGEVDTYLTLSASGISKALEWRTALNANGTNIVRAPLGDGYNATLSSETDTSGFNYILVNGERIVRTATFNTFRGSREDAEAGGVVMTPTNYITTQYASIEDGGKAILYKCNNYDASINICRGDLQKSAITNLKVIMQSLGAKKYFTGNDSVKVEPWASPYDLLIYVTVEKNAPVKLDTSFLSYLIDYADKLIEDGELNGVIPVVTEKFNNALSNAKEVLKIASDQSQVDKATEELLEAIHLLEFKQADKTELINLIAIVEKYEANSSKYIQSTYTPFQNALNKAREIVADENEMDAAVVFNAWKNLADATAKLRLIPDKSALLKSIKLAEEVDTALYTKDSVELFTFAFTNAKETYENDDADQATVDSATVDLDTAKEDLIPLGADNPKNDGASSTGTKDDGASETKDSSITDKFANPKTGDYASFIGIAALIGLAGIIIIICNRKKQF